MISIIFAGDRSRASMPALGRRRARRHPGVPHLVELYDGAHVLQPDHGLKELDLSVPRRWQHGDWGRGGERGGWRT